MTRILAAALSVVFLLPAGALAQDDRDDDDHHEGEAHGVHILHAWSRATSGDTALVFMHVENTSDEEVRIVGGEAEIADAVELVGFQLQDGEPAYVTLPPVPLGSGRAMEFKPRELALRMTGLGGELVEGGEFEIEVEFDFGHLAMHVQIESANAMQHSHAGHQH